jgi:hypothetical protein
MPKSKPGEKRLFLKFERPEDIALLDRLEKDASDSKRRYDVQTYILLILHEAYPAPNTASENPPA